MPVSTSTEWTAKARALDRYRWALLRERHGLIGSILRFARDATLDWWFGVCAKFRSHTGQTLDGCDFLLLQSAPKVVKLKRKQRFMDALRARGHSLVEVALPPRKRILTSRQLKRPAATVPTRYYGYAAHAEWVVAYYQPRILLNDRNGSLYSPFLRLALNSRGKLLVHLAHATTVEASRRLGMNDYDYYFVFGGSSLDALKARSLRFGATRVVLAGSHMIDRTFDIRPAAIEGRDLLLLGVGPDKEREPGYRKTYEMVRQWTMDNPGYRLLVKLHPRSMGEFWAEASRACDRIELLSRDVSLADALARSSLVLSLMSNAVIEAALAGRPVVPVHQGDGPDIFSQERYFGTAIGDAAALSQRIHYLDFHAAVERSHQFASYHLAEGIDGLDNTITQLEKLLRDEPVVATCLAEALPLTQDMSDLNHA